MEIAMTKIQEYKEAVVNRALYQARLCCDPDCKDCSWFDECQGRVDKAEEAVLLELAQAQ
jgi:hypothetical protein